MERCLCPGRVGLGLAALEPRSRLTRERVESVRVQAILADGTFSGRGSDGNTIAVVLAAVPDRNAGHVPLNQKVRLRKARQFIA